MDAAHTGDRRDHVAGAVRRIAKARNVKGFAAITFGMMRRGTLPLHLIKYFTPIELD